MSGLLTALGCLALGFGLAGVYFADSFGTTASANLALAGVLLAAAVIGVAMRSHGRHAGLARRVWLGVVARVTATLVLAGVLLYASSQVGSRWDLTPETGYTLSDYSRRLLARLDTDVDAVLVGVSGAGSKSEMLLRLYAAASPHFHLELAAPQVLDPMSGRPAGGVQLYLRSGERTARATGVSERSVAQTLLQLVTPTHTNVCFIDGHGELAADDAGARGLRVFARMLEREGYTQRSLVLARAPDVPADCGVVVLAAPQRALLPEEGDALNRYYDGGGRVLVLLEPERPVEPVALLEQAGISAPEGTVIDPEGRIYGAQTPGSEPLIGRFTAHPVTRGLDAHTRVLVAGARPLALHGAGPRGLVWASTSASIRAPAADAATPASPAARPSAIPLVAIAERDAGAGRVGRVIVFGDADIASNGRIGLLYNEDLLLNAVNHLASRDEEIDIRPKLAELYQYPLQPERTIGAFQSIALLIPEALLALGIVTWWRRRRL